MIDYQNRNWNEWIKNFEKKRARREFRRQVGKGFELFGMIASVTVATILTGYVGYLIFTGMTR